MKSNKLDLETNVLVGAAELAERYSVRPATVRTWFRSGHLHGRRIGRDWRASWASVFAFEGSPPAGRSPHLLALARARLLTPDEMSISYSCSIDTVLRWRRDGRMTGCLVGGRFVRFRRDLLERATFPAATASPHLQPAQPAQSQSKAQI
jgi:hypothetical protein